MAVLSRVLLRWLLLLYPARFRHRHGDSLLQDSADLLRSARERRGLVGVALLWPRLLRDMVLGGLGERTVGRPRIPAARVRLPVLDTLVQDLGFARRAMARRPATTLLAVLVLALGIGATVSMFSVLDAVVLRPLPYPDADRLASIYTTIPEWRGDSTLDSLWNRGRWEYDEFREWRARQSSFTDASLVEDVSATLTGRGPAVRVQVGLAGLDLFALLGAAPDRGRFFDADDQRDPAVVVVSHGFWRDHLGGADDALGQRILLDGVGYAIVGVLPPGFAVSGFPGDVWIPIFSDRPGGYFPGNTGDHDHVFHALGVLRLGVTPAAAAEETGRLLRAIDGPDHFTEHDANVLLRLRDETRGVRAPMLLLMGAVLLLLVVACANVATFLLGQAIDRQHEIAVRSTVGADAGRIVRQLLTESVFLGTLSGVAGLALARLGISGLTLLAPADLPRIDAVDLDLRAAGVAVGVSLLAGLVFGLAPALSLRRACLAGALGSVRAAGAGRSRLQSAMVVGEMTLATVLLMGAGLLTRSFLSLNEVDPGFRADGVVVLQLAFDRDAYRDAAGAFQPLAMRAHVDELVDAVAALPEVDEAASASVVPFGFAGFSPASFIEPEGVRARAGEILVGHHRFVTPGYFAVLGIPLLEGRVLEARDNLPDAESVVVVTETLARRFWPDESAIGKRLGWRGDRPSRIVGVVGSVRNQSLGAPPPMQFYAAPAPYGEDGESGSAILARTRGSTSAAIARIRDLVGREAPALPITMLAPLSDLVSGSLDAARFRTRLIAAFALVAALLSALGLYGVTSRAVAGRGREIGIRVALGAKTGRVVALVLRDGVRLSLVGVLIGLPIALAGTRLLQGLLYGVAPNDPVTVVAIVGLVAAIGTFATLAPSLRAARVNPVDVLRSE